MLEVENLRVRYGRIEALRGVDVDVDEGEHVAVLGPNGAGKSTLMRTVIGHETPAEGTVRYRGEDVTGLPAWERAERGITLIPEGGRVFPEASVRHNLETGAYLEDDEDTVADRLADVFELFPRLEERRGQRAETLSGGEQQMLAIGRAMMSDPDLVLVDEVTMGLMPTLVDRAFEVLAELNARGVSLLQAEQNVHKTLEVADRVYVLENGRIAASGTPDELRDSKVIEESYLGAD